MYYVDNTSNKIFKKLSERLLESGCSSPLSILGVLDMKIMNISPYSSRMSKEKQVRVMAECTKNPWYVLRSVLRVQVGTSKRFVNMSDGEMLALINFLNGGRTIVSAPIQTVKTNLLAIAALMTMPKIVLFSGSEQGEEIRSIMNEYIKIMPPYLKEFFNKNSPRFLHVIPYITEDGISVAGYNNSDIIILQDDFEFDPRFNLSSLNRMEEGRLKRSRARTSKPVRHLMVSSVNAHLNKESHDFLNSLEYIRYDNVGAGREIYSHRPSYDTRLVPIKLEHVTRLKSDKKLAQYYKNILLKQDIRVQRSVDTSFITR